MKKNKNKTQKSPPNMNNLTLSLKINRSCGALQQKTQLETDNLVLKFQLLKLQITDQIFSKKNQKELIIQKFFKKKILKNNLKIKIKTKKWKKINHPNKTKNKFLLMVIRNITLIKKHNNQNSKNKGKKPKISKTNSNFKVEKIQQQEEIQQQQNYSKDLYFKLKMDKQLQVKSQEETKTEESLKIKNKKKKNKKNNKHFQIQIWNFKHLLGNFYINPQSKVEMISKDLEAKHYPYQKIITLKSKIINRKDSHQQQINLLLMKPSPLIYYYLIFKTLYFSLEKIIYLKKQKITLYLKAHQNHNLLAQLIKFQMEKLLNYGRNLKIIIENKKKLTMSRVYSGNRNQKEMRSYEEELDHQMKKSKLLEADRTAFWKSGEETKQKNKEYIRQLKQENAELKKLRDELIANKRATAPGVGNKTSQGFGQFQGDVRDENFWKRKLDQEKHLTKKSKDQLLQLQDKLNEVSETKFGAIEESSSQRQIRILENRLDKVMIKFNEAQSIKKTYEQIVKRLKEERVGYDNQLAAIERSLKGKEHDYEELLLLAHDAQHAKELAEAERNKYQHKMAAVKELRKTYLEDKRKAIEDREKTLKKTERQQEQQNLKSSLNQQELMNQEPQHHIDTNMQKVKYDDYTEAFRKLHEATGVTDVNEIIQKFTTQDETAKSLNDLKQQYSDRIDELQKKIEDNKELLNSFKYEGGDTMTRKQLDEIEENVNIAVAKCERTKLKYERVSKILVNVKAGIEHLYDKLYFQKLNGKGSIVVTDETLVEALSQIVEKMKIIYQPVKNSPNYNPEDFKQSAQGAANYISLNLLGWNPKEGGLQKNCRINFPDKNDEDVSNDEMDDDNDLDQATQKLKQKYEAQAKHDRAMRNKSQKNSKTQKKF